MLTRVRDALKTVDTTESELTTARKIRQQLFFELDGLVSRIVGAVGCSDILEEKVEKFATIVRKFKGRRATPRPKPATTPNEGKINSTSQLSYDRKEDNFSEIVTFLKGEPNYLTNETDLKVDALEAMVKELAARNDDVRKAYGAYTFALITRNDLFFEPVSGLVPCSKAVKQYVRSVCKPTSPEIKSISGIRFTSRKN